MQTRVISFYGITSRIILCSSSSRKYPGTEGTNQNRLWYHHTYRCDDTRSCVMQFWPPDDEHMCSKHVETWNKLIVKQKFCAIMLAKLLAPELFFLILAHSVYKMWIIQETSTLELWNKLHFEEEKKTESIYHI